MGLALILAAALAWWLHKRGELLPNLLRLGGSGAALLLALKLLEGGHLLGAGVAALCWMVLGRPLDPRAGGAGGGAARKPEGAGGAARLPHRG